MYCYAQIGIQLPHYSGFQQNLGTPVPMTALIPGDLVFMGYPVSYHVALYAGNGQVIEAPYTGAVVSYGSLAGFQYAVRTAVAAAALLHRQPRRRLQRLLPAFGSSATTSLLVVFIAAARGRTTPRPDHSDRPCVRATPLLLKAGHAAPTTAARRPRRSAPPAAHGDTGPGLGYTAAMPSPPIQHRRDQTGTRLDRHPKGPAPVARR